jgi:hypothetical protein
MGDLSKMEFILLEKAYGINLDMIEDGFLYSPIITYAKNKGKAKSNLLFKVRYDGMKLRFSGEEISFTTIPVIRSEEYDKVIINGFQIIRGEIEGYLRKETRKNLLISMEADPTITHCYIHKGSYYRPNACGYTSLLTEAGVYEKADALRHARGCEDIVLIPINVLHHNQMISSKIEELRTHFISLTEEV